ncbi:holo-ACP synthase [Liquorilactobacillus satsumensis]|uniref:holo-ACP synthase n=1 Tax=Liquorilactobacillus satsumensis TaxID=259059 RepID=UPI0039EBBF34
MILGTGIDITEIARIKEAAQRHAGFVQRVLTPAEVEYFEKYGGRRRYEFLAGRFSAKESYSKAIGTGIGKTVHFQDIEIIEDGKTGKPQITRHPRSELRAHISISHTATLVMTEVILESNQ